MSAGTARAAAAVLAAAVCCLCLAGCYDGSPISKTVQTDKAMTVAGSARQVLALYRATQGIVGADGWYQVESVLSDCGEKADNAAYFLDMERDLPVADAQAKRYAVQVQKAWKRQGVDAQLVRDPNIDPPSWVLSAPPYLTGTYPDGSLYKFYAGKDRIQFAVQGTCGAGPRPAFGGPDWPQFPTQPPTTPTPPATTAPAAPAAPGASGEADP